MDIDEQIQRDLDDWNRQILEITGQGKKKHKRPPIPNSVKNEILVRQQYRCYNCKQLLPAIKHFHHKKHISEGGKSTLDNLIVLCPNCHNQHHHQENLSGRTKRDENYEDEGYNPQNDIDDAMRRMGF